MGRAHITIFVLYLLLAGASARPTPSQGASVILGLLGRLLQRQHTAAERPVPKITQGSVLRPVSKVEHPLWLPEEAEMESMRRKLAQRRPSAGTQPPVPCAATVGPTGDFRTVQAAVNSAGLREESDPYHVICISPGVYNERVFIRPGQNKIFLLGQGPQTVIRSATSAAETGGPFESGTLTVEGNLFVARDLSIQNVVLSIKTPCPAVVVKADQTTWIHVSMMSWCDTLAIGLGASHLFKFCFISGLTDMNWGFGRAAFVSTEFYSRLWQDDTTLYTGHLATFGTDLQISHVTSGAVFWNCNITGDGRTYLGRPYRPESVAVYINCFLDKTVYIDGWDEFFGRISAGGVTFREYNSRGPGASAIRKYGQVMKSPPPAEFAVQEFIGRLN